MIFFNWIGLGMAILGALIGYGANYLIGGKSGFIVAGIALFIIDILYRISIKDEYGGTSTYQPKRGGNIIFLPIWLIGIGVIIYGLFYL
jgi:hypothetical protein